MLRRIILMLLILVACAAMPACAAKEPWTDLLQQASLTPEKAQLPEGRWRGGGLYTISMFDKLWNDWRLIDNTTITTAKRFEKASRSFYNLGLVSADIIDIKPVFTKMPKTDTLTKESLVTAIMDLNRSLGSTLSYSQLQDLKAKVRVVPDSVAEAAAVIVQSVPEAIKKRNQAFIGFGGPETLAVVQSKALPLGLNMDLDDDTLRLMDKVDLTSLVDGGLLVAQAVDSAHKILRHVEKTDFSFSWETLVGRIVLNGKKNDTYTPGQYLLVIDTGGNDAYMTAASANYTVPVSVVIDLAGNDKYQSTEQGAICAAVLGYSYLLDSSGNDTYKIVNDGLASGIFGVSMLMDCNGDDTYECRESGQALGVYGIGVLSDFKGNDKYTCFEKAQGYASTRGCGALIDLAGNDNYLAYDTPLDYPSPQTADHNTSLAQGCGFGRRAHPGDQHSLAGGLGILVDVKGNDTYKAGLFAQGVSYWYSLGMLVDMSGNDSYQGVWYNQGASAHYAVAALCDLSGNDKYVASMNQSQGHGRDQSIGWLHDLSGNDYYECPGMALGSTSINSIGIFWDQAGNDEYKSGGASFGYADGGNPGALSLGMFLDQGGTNKFPAGLKATQGKYWREDPLPDQPLAYGIGLSQ